MYYPIGWPRILDGRGATGGSPIQLLRHRSKNLVFELREHSVAVWHSRLHILLASFKLSPGNITKHGVNSCAAVKPDGSCMAISTTNGLLYFLHIIYDTSTQNSSKWRYSYREHGITRHTPGLEAPAEGPPLEEISFKLTNEVVLSGGTLVLCPIAGSLMASTEYGVIHRINWEGVFDKKLSIELSSVVFGNDLLPETRAQLLNEPDCAVDISYSLELHGLAVVLSSGRVAFLTGKTARFLPDSLRGVWLRETTDAVCVSVNPRYNLIACGRANGLVDTYSFDEISGSWILTNTLQLSKLHFADSDQYQLGQVQCLKWSANDYSVLVVAWRNGGLSIWSVFGSLLFHSLGNQPGTPTPLFRSQSTLLQSLCWSNDGYQLWILPRGEQLLNRTSSFQQKEEKQESHEEEEEMEKKNPDHVMIAGSHVIVIQFVKSAFINNPVIPNYRHLLLHSADQLYLGLLSMQKDSTESHSNVKGNSFNGYYGNDNNVISGLGKAEGVVPQWKVLKFPSTYLTLNWPIQYVAISENGEYIVVVGRAGFCVFLIRKRKWKLFGSELQEQSLICRGGVTWYQDVVIFPCRVNEKNEEIHFYTIHENFDTSRVLSTLHLTSPALRLNVFGNHLVVATRDCSVNIYNIILSRKLDKSINFTVSKLHVMSFISSLSRPWVSTLVSIMPSNIRTEPGTNSGDELESILFNIAGLVLLSHREVPRPQTLPDKPQDSWSFSAPVSLAPYVEAVWTPPIISTHSDSTKRDHMMESLWFACGAHGIKVWLPLYPQDEGHPTFLSKRIMLTLPSSSSFPQSILLSEAVIVGVSHEPLHGDHSLTTPLYFPPTTVRRITRLFLNHVLRQLLKRNLGSHAFNIARRHAHLPYFAHILELMLHEILEEEASGSIPIPDALLPRAIEFIKQFPQFLETVGSCARKTEVALWHYLFAAVGNPKDLFELCLSDTRLKTAASYLIIIQNLEPLTISRHLATCLLDAALDNNQWDLCKDLVRFLKAIGPGDGSNPTSPVSSIAGVTPSTPHSKNPKSSGSTSLHPNSASSSTLLPDLDQSVVSVARDHLNSGSTSNIVSVSGDFCDSTGKIIKRPHFALDVDSKEEYFIELILSRHARKLLSSRCIKDLGLFAAHLDFDLVQWMGKERHRAARIEDYIKTLCELHKQFHWPFPASSTLNTPTSVTMETITPVMSSEYNHDGEEKEERVDEGKQDDSEELEDSPSVLRRPNRPPDLNISGVDAKMNIVETEITDVGVIPPQANVDIVKDDEAVIIHNSTPTKSATGSYSFVSDSLIKNSSVDRFLLPEDTESLVETIDDTYMWEGDNNVSMTTVWTVPTKSIQAEREMRYFVNITNSTFCLEWSVILGILLQDITIFIDLSNQLNNINPQIVLPEGMGTWLLEGVASLGEWAAKNSPGYLPFLSSITPYLHQWCGLINIHIRKQQEHHTNINQSQSNDITENMDSSKEERPLTPAKQINQDSEVEGNETSGCTLS